MTTDTQTPRTTCVVVHCGDLDGGRLERRLRSVTSTVPASARVVATVLGRRHLSPSTARRVTAVVVRDGGAALLEREVSDDQHVIVLPFEARVDGDWYADVLARLDQAPLTVGVLPLGEQHLFAYPAATTALDAERVAWTPVTGVSARERSTSRTSRPSLSSVLIVKDEEMRLGSCLAALAGVVDEVVVYDTGSSDSTLDIARAHGAVVVEGYWDDDFSAARNRALVHATCEWVLSVDADEVLTTDATALARWLSSTRGDAALVSVVSPATENATEGDEIRAVRLFRREGAAWQGALHEQVVAAPGARARVACTSLPPVRLMHSGYALGHEKAAEKAVRNLAVAEAAHRKTPYDDAQWPEAAVAYARALGQAGRSDECLVVLRTVVDREVTSGNVVQAARGAVPLLLQRSLFDEAEYWTQRSATAGEAPGLTALRRALLRYGRGEHQAAVADLVSLVDGAPRLGGADLWNRPFDMGLAAVTLAELQVATGQSHAAATRMVHLMLGSPDTVPLATLLRTVLAAGGDLVDLASNAPEPFVARSLREAAVAVPDLALTWVAALAKARPSDPRPLAAGSVLAARISVEVALEWSVLAREAGFFDLCPLRTIAADPALHPRSRLLALGLLAYGLSDHTLEAQWVDLTGSSAPEDQHAALSELRRYVPGVGELASSPA